MPSRRSRPRTETANADARRREILDAAAELFSGRRYSGVSVEEIAAAGGMGKSTLYHYFSSRDQILMAMHAQAADRTLSAAEEIRETEMTPRQALRANMINTIRFIQEKPGYQRIFFGHYRELSEPMLEEVAAKRDGHAAYIEELIEQAVERGEFRPVNPRLTMLALFGMCNWTYQWLEHRPDLSAEQIGGAFADILFAGLAR